MLRQARRQGRMIFVRMRDNDACNCLAGVKRVQDRVHMGAAVRPRIDDPNLVGSKNVGPGARVGHGRRVRCRDSQNAVLQHFRLSDCRSVTFDKHRLSLLGPLNYASDMIARTIKRYLPRRLFGRFVLIILVPIVTLQLIISIIVIQRHFDGVSFQLVRGLAGDLRLIQNHLDAGETFQAAAQTSETLGISLTALPAETPMNRQLLIHWYDWSGRLVEGELERQLRTDLGVDLTRTFRRAFIQFDTDQGPVEASVHRTRVSASNPQQLIMTTVAASILLAVISIVFMRNQVRPIRRLAQAAEAFGKGRSVQFRPQGAEEVRRAGSAFVAMRSRIERQIEQRTLMLSGISHDLRTPLTRIKLALEMAATPEDLADVSRDLDEMEHMIAEFLEFSSGGTLEAPTPTHLDHLVRDVAKDFSSGGDQLDVRVRFESGVAAEFPVRKMALRRAIGNLIGNAQKHADTVRLSLNIISRVATVTVEDNGPGIPAEQRETALKPFARLDDARNQDHGGGVGLGLAIAADISRAHGGRLTLDDSPDLGGLRAVITLPR